MLALALLAACGSAAGGEPRAVPTGTWGGEHVLLEVVDDGGAIELDCAHGAIAEPLALDENGRFEGRGTYVQERGGPVREGEDDSRPARYAGRVEGRTMTLTITLGDGGKTLGPFALTHGRAARLTKCL